MTIQLEICFIFMKKNSFFVALMLTCAILLISCEREITVNLPQTEAQIVVEGYIESDTIPLVILSKNIPYFSNLDFTQLSRIFIKGAKVTVINETDHDTVALQEFNIPSDTLEFTFYTVPNPIAPNAFSGKIGKTYRLNIEVEGKKLTAVTTIPKPVAIDSIIFLKVDSINTPFPPKNHDSLYRMEAYFRDPPVEKNYYHYWTARSSVNIDTYSERDGSFFYLALFDGKYVPRFWVQGSRISGDTITKNARFFKLGDTVSLKWGAIDEAQYDFWDTYTSNVQGGGPFSPPVIVKSNIQGGLGIWAGTGLNYYTRMLVKKDAIYRF